MNWPIPSSIDGGREDCKQCLDPTLEFTCIRLYMDVLYMIRLELGDSDMVLRQIRNNKLRIRRQIFPKLFSTSWVTKIKFTNYACQHPINACNLKKNYVENGSDPVQDQGYRF
jgi:hypothetical protein